MLELVRGLAELHGEAVRIFAPGNALVHTYREPLFIALQAIIDNSTRFGTKVEIFIFGSNEDWCIDVRDNGPGIPKERFKDVLAPFVRLDESRGRTSSGFGLGISMAHQVLRRFGGSLSLSDTGRGLRVLIHVPKSSSQYANPTIPS